MALRSQISCISLLLFTGGLLLLQQLPLSETATDYNRYLAHIFKKYGNGGTMSFEGLEHLMHNLGLGRIEFEPDHTIDEHRPKNYNIDAKVKSDLRFRNYIDDELYKLLPNSTENDIKMKDNSLIHKSDQKKNISDPEERDHRNGNIMEDGIILEFKEIHDPKHRHPREKDVSYDDTSITENVCLSPKSILRLLIDQKDLHERKLYKTVKSDTSVSLEDPIEEEFNDFINNIELTPVAFMKLCPALLAQIDQQVCFRPAPMVQDDENLENMYLRAWIYASLSIFILSACGLVGIMIVPLMKSTAYREILKFLVAVAVGTLSGDALMHLLPHALEQKKSVGEHEHEHEHEHEQEYYSGDGTTGHKHDMTPVFICGCAFATAVFMYILENLLPLLKGDSQGHGHSHGTGHSHSHVEHQHSLNNNNGSSVIPTSTTPSTVTTIVVPAAKEINVMLNESKEDKKAPSRPLTPLAFMVVIGDGLHNLTDGLAVGAAFASDPVTGLATAFAVLCHELPHELGDFALLLQTGVTIKRAICLNIISSVLSFIGMAIGLLIAGVHSNMTQWIYAGTAGSFLYIAFADLLPAMTAESNRNIKSVIIEITGIIIGGFIMLLIAINEENLEQLFK